MSNGSSFHLGSCEDKSIIFLGWERDERDGENQDFLCAMWKEVSTWEALEYKGQSRIEYAALAASALDM